MRRVTGALLGLAIVAGARGAAAQSWFFGYGMGGTLVGQVRSAALDSRLEAAGRRGVGGVAPGLMIPLEASFGPARVALALDVAFPIGNVTRELTGFGAGVLFGGRLRQGGWVFLPSVGPSHSSTSLCVKGPAGAAPKGGVPLFDQVLSAAGSGECLESSGWGMRFEIGVDREIWAPSKEIVRPGFYIGLRASLTLPMEGGWQWRDMPIDGPAAPLLPTLGLVAGVRLGRPE